MERYINGSTIKDLYDEYMPTNVEIMGKPHRNTPLGTRVTPFTV